MIEAILSYMKLIVTGLFFVALIFLYSENVVLEKEKNNALKKAEFLTESINKQNTYIQNLVLEEQKKQKELSIATGNAKKIADEYNKKTKNILSLNVSSNCMRAIEWASRNGKIINKCWVI